MPLHLYSEFRNVMSKKPFEPEAAIKTYRLLIQSSPPANQYLLLYVLDLLAVFARKSDKNLMTAANLATIFQPGMFSHPSHLTSAEEHQVAVQVLEFLIEHQEHFVLGLSPPPPPHVRPEDLTVAARAPPMPRLLLLDASGDAASTPGSGPSGARGEGVDDEALVPSDSDEELGELEAHEGGGAAIAKRAAALHDARMAARAEQRKNRGEGLFAKLRRSSLQPIDLRTLPPPPSPSPSPALKAGTMEVAGGGDESGAAPAKGKGKGKSAAGESMLRSRSAQSERSAGAQQIGTFLEGRDVGGPAEGALGLGLARVTSARSSTGSHQNSSSKQKAAATGAAAAAGIAGGAPLRRSRTTPTKKKGRSSGGGAGGVASPSKGKEPQRDTPAAAATAATSVAAAAPAAAIAEEEQVPTARTDAPAEGAELQTLAEANQQKAAEDAAAATPTAVESSSGDASKAEAAPPVEPLPEGSAPTKLLDSTSPPDAPEGSAPQ